MNIHDQVKDINLFIYIKGPSSKNENIRRVFLSSLFLQKEVW